MDEQEVEHIDLDSVIQLYIDEYKKIRIRIQKRLKDVFVTTV